MNPNSLNILQKCLPEKLGGMSRASLNSSIADELIAEEESTHSTNL